MKLRQHGIRVLLVLDGQGNSLKALTMLSDDDAKRKLYASNVMDLVEKYNFDGVDIDWEYPGVSGLDTTYYTTQRDQMNLNKLMRDLKNEMFKRQGLYGTPYILSAAIPSTSWGSQRYDFSGEASRKLSGDKTLGGINDYCDYVNMMSYDLNKETNASHLTACFTSKSSGDFKFSCAYGVERFTSLGLDKNKIILGSAAYGKAYRISGNVNMSSVTPALGMSAALTIVDGVIGSYASGTIYYSGIKQLMETGKYKEYTEYNGTKVVGSYLYSNETKIYVTFDSVTSVTAKCQYAKQNGFGIMVWAYGEDSTDTIVDTICDNL
jgi:chitinase